MNALAQTLDGICLNHWVAKYNERIKMPRLKWPRKDIGRAMSSITKMLKILELGTFF